MQMSNETLKPLGFVDTSDSVLWRMDSNRQDDNLRLHPVRGTQSESFDRVKE
jgi:hypothetical protein